eukprot:gene514-286_t
MHYLSSLVVGSVPTKVFLMAGQSNMEGYGPIYADGDDCTSKNPLGGGNESCGLQQCIDLPDDICIATERHLLRCNNIYVNFPHGDGGRLAYGPLVAGFGVDPNHFGPELGFGHGLKCNGPTRFEFYKAAWGGTALGNIEEWLPPSSGGPGKLYSETIDTFKAYIEANPGYEIEGFIWLQGWNDQFSPPGEDYLNSYEANLYNLVNDVRHDLGVADLLTVIVESPAGEEGAEILRSARKNVVDFLNADISTGGNAYYIDNSDLYTPTKPGQYHFHFNAENYLKIGDRIATVVKEANAKLPLESLTVIEGLIA